MVTIKSPEILHISDGSGFTYGADQIWYRSLLQRKAGCGPTCASHIIWYLSSAMPHCAGLTKREGSTKSGFLALMEDMWKYVTPGFRGVNKTSMLMKGVERYASERGFSLRCEALEIPQNKAQRPNIDEFMSFIEQAIAADSPVAFLNLHNGGVAGLDTWHWVTLIGLDRERRTALMYDQGLRVEIDIDQWLRETKAGGGIVRVNAE